MKRPVLLVLLLFATVAPCVGSVDVLLAATDAELQPLIAQLESPHTETRAAWQFWTGTLRGKKVALTRTEGDPLNAVAATTLAIRRYVPRLVVTFGLARPEDPSLRSGDVVVSGSFVALDGMISPPRKPEAGSNALAWHKLAHPLMASGEVENYSEHFPADPAALEVAKNLSAGRGRLVIGVLGSANQVNREADRIAWLHAQWGTSTEDGESAHVAGCAQLLGVPVIGLRIVEGTDGEAAALVMKFLEASK